MRNKLAIKMLFRSPFKTLLTFLLLFASSFMMVYNLADYAMTGREFARSMENYQGYVSLDVERELKAHQQAYPFFLLSDPTNEANYDNYYRYERFHMPSLSNDDLETISQMPYVSYASKRYMTAGISSVHQRTDVQRGEYHLDRFYGYNGRFVIEATVESVERTYSHYRNTGQALGSTDGYILNVSHVKALAGREDWIFRPEYGSDPESIHKIVVNVPTENYNDEHWVLGYSPDDRHITVYKNNSISLEMIDSLIPGQRYVIVGRISGHGQLPEEETEGALDRQIGDDTLYNWWPYIYSLEGKTENYLDTEEFASLRELIEVTNNDLHTFDVVYTDNMSAIRRVAENRMLLTGGRFLTAEDTENKSPVCVVSDTMLNELGLEIGDTISLRLGDRLMEQYAPLGAVASTRGRYAENFTEEQEFEIVGSYVEVSMNKMLDVDLCWAYSDNTVFVPLSYLPVSEEKLAEHEFKPSEVSFVISDAANIRAFYDEQIPKLQEMGYQVHFSDSGWMNIEQYLTRSNVLTVSKLIAFASAALLSSLLTVYLFIVRKKREFAIMRALGTPRPKARRSLLIPLMLLAVAAIIPGGFFAALYAQIRAEFILADFIELGLSVDTSLQLPAIAIGIFVELLVLFVAAFVGLVHIGRKPPLALLQANETKRTKKKSAPVLVSETEFIPQFSHIQTIPIPSTGQYNALRHVFSYVARHIRRSRMKALLSVALALVLCFAMGQLSAMRDSYSELYRNIEVYGRIVNGMPLYNAQKIEKSDYVSSTYFEYYFHGETNREWQTDCAPCGFYMVSDPLRVITSPIEYLEGYDYESVKNATKNVCVVSESILDDLSLALGDKIDLNERNFINTLMSNGSTYEEALTTYVNRSVKCTIVGKITGSGHSMVYIPIGSRQYYNSLMPSVNLDFAEYVLSDYHQAAEFMKYVQNEIAEVNSTTKPILIMDTAEADNIYMIYRLIEILYPIALIVAVLIGSILPALIIMQNAKEASLLRVLGTSKTRTRVILLLEPIILCIVGMLIAVVMLYFANDGRLPPEALSIYCSLHFAGCIIGTSVVSGKVTKRNVLELLQVKE